MTNEDRQFLAVWRQAPPAERQAMRELLFRWRNGAGPDIAAVDIWFRDKVAEIKARDKAKWLARSSSRREEIRRRLREDFGGKNAGG